MVTRLGHGAFFGEMALLHPEGRSVATVRVETFMEGYHISRDDADELFAALDVDHSGGPGERPLEQNHTSKIPAKPSNMLQTFSNF